MMQVGQYVAEDMRNPPGTSDLEYPYTFAHNIDGYLVWHRDTGEIVWFVAPLGEEGYRQAREQCFAF